MTCSADTSGLPTGATGSYSAIETTVTDFGSSLSTSLPSCAVADTGFGTTAFGASKVLTLSTFGAVRVSPTAA